MSAYRIGDRVTSQHLRMCGVEVGTIKDVLPGGGYWVASDDDAVGMLLFDRDIVSATIKCQCGAPLTELVEVWTGECAACGMPASLQVPMSSWMIATASVNGRARLAARDGYTPQDAINEYNRDIEDDAVRVTCAGCGDTERVIEPDDPYWCALCTVSAVS